MNAKLRKRAERIVSALTALPGQRAAELLQQVGLAGVAPRYPETLSGGEQQRCAIARAFAARPRLLFADEPTGNLDRRNSEYIHDLLMELNAELNMTLIVVTHNMELASYMSRNMTIVDGQLIELKG